jgi:hypothetical protein
MIWLVPYILFSFYPKEDLTMVSSKTDIVFLVVVAVVAYWFGVNSQTGSSSGVGTRTDVATGIDFPTTKSFSDAKHKHKPAMSLLGVGTRKKTILNIYSLGLFVSSPIERKLKGVEGARICSTVLESTSPKAVQLTFAMGIGPEKIAEAVSQLSGVDKDVQKEFHDMIVDGLGGGKMQKGESMIFEWKGSDTISVTARGNPIGTMKNKALANGVFELYMGPKSVSPTLLNDLGCR